MTDIFEVLAEWSYLGIFLILVGVNTAPILMPPSWIILTSFYLMDPSLNIVLLAMIGATAATKSAKSAKSAGSKTGSAEPAKSGSATERKAGTAAESGRSTTAGRRKREGTTATAGRYERSAKPGGSTAATAAAAQPDFQRGRRTDFAGAACQRKRKPEAEKNSHDR